MAYSFHFVDLRDQIVQVLHPEWVPEYCVFDLNRCRSRLVERGLTPIWSYYLQPETVIWVLPANWFDPREPLAPNQPNEQSTWFQFLRMAEFYDHMSFIPSRPSCRFNLWFLDLAEVGMNGPSARIPCEAVTMSPPDFDDPDPAYTSRVLEGYELDEFVPEAGLNWRDFAGATPVVTATPPPSWVPSRPPPPPPSCPPPPPRPSWTQEDFIPVPPLSPPPGIPSRKRCRVLTRSKMEGSTELHLARNLLLLAIARVHPRLVETRRVLRFESQPAPVCEPDGL